MSIFQLAKIHYGGGKRDFFKQAVRECERMALKYFEDLASTFAKCDVNVSILGANREMPKINGRVDIGEAAFIYVVAVDSDAYLEAVCGDGEKETIRPEENDRLHRVLSLLFSNAAIEDCDEDEGEDEQSESD
jgi:hypothetical protein